MNMEKEVLLEARDICKHYKKVQAVNHISFTLYKGETLGLVGESGCGKTTLARTILRLTDPTSGQVIFEGKDLTAMSKRELRSMRKDISIVFQDPYSSLHPRMTIRQAIEEPMKICRIYKTAEERKANVSRLLQLVGLNDSHMDRYPHEFSGGQRQRIVIARALATNPKLIVCDEPVSALDVSVRAQILNLLKELQQKLNLTYLFISHDLSVVEYLCDRVNIMYLGQLVESGTTEDIYGAAGHPYTRALLSAAPQVDSFGRRSRILLTGDVPSPANPPEGCRFRTRCRYADEGCKQRPGWEQLTDTHGLACLKHAQIDSSTEE